MIFEVNLFMFRGRLGTPWRMFIRWLRRFERPTDLIFGLIAAAAIAAFVWILWTGSSHHR